MLIFGGSQLREIGDWEGHPVAVSAIKIVIAAKGLYVIIFNFPGKKLQIALKIDYRFSRLQMTIIRLLFVLLIGFAFMFVVQPSFFTGGTITLEDVTPEDWVGGQYRFGAGIVFVASSLGSLIWYGLASYYNDRDNRLSVQGFRIIWASLSLLPFASILLSLFLFQESRQAIPYLAFFYVLDALWLFWVATAISTPESLKYGVVPGSYFLRHLPFLK